MKALQNFLRKNILSIISLVVFLIAWQIITVYEIVPRRMLVPPTEVVELFFDKLNNPDPDGATLLAHFKTSITLALSGFGLAMIIGVPLGLLMGWYQRFDNLVRPIFEVMRPIPPIAWIPLAILWFGIGLGAKSFIIWLSAFVPCVINSYTGIKLTDPVLVRVARIFGATDREIFFKIGIPSAVPMVFTGLRLSLNSAWMTLVAAELLAATEGLGYMIQMGRRLLRPDIIVLGMLTIGLVGAILAGVLGKIEQRITMGRRM
ncbi:MAG: transporter permease [Peptococcaceae bacterium]|jgi:NitT/TauT family transport system permease protein|nr:transporter permease [Peptococcaceae bacterium]